MRIPCELCQEIWPYDDLNEYSECPQCVKKYTHPLETLAPSHTPTPTPVKQIVLSILSKVKPREEETK